MVVLLKILMSSIILTAVCETCLGYETNKTNTTNRTSLWWNEVRDLTSDTLRDVLRVLWKECSSKTFSKNSSDLKRPQTFLKCAKEKMLKALDRTLDSDVIYFGPGVQFVKYEKLKDNRNEKFRTVDDANWPNIVLEKLENFFNTHVLKFDLKDVENDTEIVESRHRRRYHMMHMMMFGMITIGMIFIPMGFQFLAALGGKALLLAKIAMVLSSIQGLKKISSSPVNYGLYRLDEHAEERGIGKTRDVDPIESQKKIKYIYDSENGLWKSELSGKAAAKRSIFNVPNRQNIFTIYPIPPYNQIRPFYSSSGQEFNDPVDFEYSIDVSALPQKSL